MVQVKTNKVVIPFHVELYKNFTWDKLMQEFSEDKMYSNFIKFGDDAHYKVSLQFIKRESDVYYFALVKRYNDNITVMDEDAKKDTKNYLPQSKRVRQHSLFAYYKKHNLILVLYNHEAFNKLVPMLKLYFAEKFAGELTCKPLTDKYTEDRLKKKIKSVRHIHLISANQNFQKFESDNMKLSPSKRVKNYTEKKEEIIKLQRMGEFSVTDIFRILKQRDYTKYDRVIIDDTNIGEIDILDDYIVEIPCDINTEQDGLAKFDDFISEIQRIIAERDDIFSKYS